MPVPSYRVPVRVARGTLAALTAGLADLQEGELCYATDENTLYVIEGGVLTPTVADLTGIEIINDTTPQLGGNLDTNSFQIISTAAGNIQIAPDTTGVTEFRGNTGNDAAIQLNCEANTHGVKIQSPPHSAAASYTLVLPEDTGTTGQALTTDGAGVLSWATPSTVGSINDLTDVDTSSAAPTDGQALIWNTADSEWVPGDVAADLGATSINALSDVDTTTASPTNDQVLAWNGTNWVPADQTGGSGAVTSIIAGSGISVDQATGDVTITATGGGGGAVDSVNGETGVVSLGIQDMDDFELYQGPLVLSWASYTTTGNAAINVNEWWSNSGNLVVSTITSTGDQEAALMGLTGFEVTVTDSAGATFTFTLSSTTADSGGAGGTRRVILSGGFSSSDNSTIDTTGGITLTSSGLGSVDILLVEGDILQWNNVDQKFKPAQLPTGGAVDSVNGEIGVVSLGIQDMDDFEPDTEIEALIWANPNTDNPGSDEFRLYSSGFARLSTTTSAGYKKDELLAYLQIGSNVELIVNSVTHTATVTVAAELQDAGSATERVNCTFDATPALSDTILADSPLVVNFLDQPSAITPLAEGDILQWSDSDQKFKPAQLSAGGGGAVDSVNGETGVVSLGIQEMDDFELQATVGGATWSGTWTIHTLSPGQCSAAGEIGPGADNGPGANICITDGDGINRSAEIDALENGSLWFRVNDGLWAEAATGTISGACSPLNKLMGCSDLYDAIGASQIGDTISVADGAPDDSFTPLAEGDILQWNDADQKFKPAQLPTGGGGAVDSVNGETGVVNIGVGQLDDFALLTQTEPSVNWSWNIVDLNTQTAGLEPGNSFVDATNTSVSPITDSGQDVIVALRAWVAAELGALPHDVVAEVDGVQYTTTITATLDEIGLSGAFRPRLRFACDLQSLVGGNADGGTLKLLSFNAWAQAEGYTDTNAPISTISLADGDILAYNAAAQEWNPAQTANSVNGETGVVSLGIQDMNDYALVVNPNGFPTYDFTDSWPSIPTTTDNRYNVDLAGVNVSINWRANDTGEFDQELFDDFGALLAGDVITVSLYNRSSTVYYLTLEGAPSTFTNGYTLSIVDDADWQAFAAEDPNAVPEGLRIAVGDTRAIPSIPLADGDILQWVDSDQEFKPAQLPEVIDKATLQSEVAASIDFADFQSRIAAL